MLGDTARFFGGDRRRTDGVQQRRLTVIHVSHDGDDRRAQLAFTFGQFHFGRCGFLGFIRLGLNFKTKVAADDGSGIEINLLINGRHDAVLHEFGNQARDRQIKPLGKFAHPDDFGN